jgi:hypothetical protein
MTVGVLSQRCPSARSQAMPCPESSVHCPACLPRPQGLQLFPALVIVPCLQLCWTLFGVISGMLYFQEYAGMTALQRAMFVLGVGVSDSLGPIAGKPRSQGGEVAWACMC